MTRKPISATPVNKLLTLFALATALVACESPSPAPHKVAPLAIGDQAPDFSLHDAQQPDHADPVTLSRLLQNGPVVVIFNMGLHCPACEQELTAFANQIDDFKKAGIQIVAISNESPAETRADLKSSAPIPFPLLADPDDKIARSFGLERPDGSIDERTFFIDQSRHLRFAYKPDQPGGEISHLLDLAKSPIPLDPRREVVSPALR